jgi:DNA-binding FadR family transcriptional regulator
MEARVLMERDLAGLAAHRAAPEELADIERTIVMMAEKILITKVVAKQKDRVLHGEFRTRTLNIKHEPARPGEP